MLFADHDDAFGHALQDPGVGLQGLFRPFPLIDIPEHGQDAVPPFEPNGFQVHFNPEDASGAVPDLPFKDLGTAGRRLGQHAQSRLQLRPGLAVASGRNFSPRASSGV